MLGTIIGEKYRLERSIGTGGMGEVFEARHLVTGRAVAVKLLYRQLPANEAAASDRFRHEAYAAGNLDAEHIVQVFDAGTDHDTRRRYLVMALLHGESLHAIIKRIGPLPPVLALCIAGQAALGLSKAHAAGVIHRDVKPANIFLCEEADEIVVKVLDFGIAKVKELDEEGPAEPGVEGDGIVGSPHYMSPEQAQGLPTLDHRSDVFSLGAVMYRLLSGQTPHPSAQTLVRLMYAICTEAVRPLSEVAPWVPPPMAAVVERAIALPPELRFQSAGEMAHAIAAVVGDLRIAPSDIAPLSDDERAGLAPSPPSLVERGGLGKGITALPPASHRAPFVGPELEVPTWPPSPARARPEKVRTSLSRKGALTTAILGAVAMALVLLAIMGLWQTRTSRGASATNAAAAASSAALAQAPPTGGAPVMRTVWVRVQPPAADEVMVDGQRAHVTAAGFLEISGELGSQHEVSVRSNARTKRTRVVITKDGAFPESVTAADERTTENEPRARA
ncbi:MAG TPA: serine/threonine-protein kinase, partial [Polyangiaceae bacterium]|nr:serine/threonine-protein kinase [Polyangiaceae bacterium]